MNAMRHTASLLLAATAWLVVAAPPALADPPGPTDYRTEVIGIDPVVAGFRMEIVGGDFFVLVETDPGVSLEVTGYQGEPYLRFLPDGTIEQNDHSPATYLNTDRYGITEVPVGISADAEPAWRVVATGGSFAWHDHRTHWMSTARPLGREPGDVILEGVIPLVVDGVSVDVTVRSVWQPAPSPAPVLAGMAAGLVIASAAAFGRARIGTLAALLVGLAAAASLLGVTALRSVPPETGPSWSLWAPPLAALALGAAAVAAVAMQSMAALRRWASAAALIGAVVLTVWGFLHREWMWRAVLPTGSPFWAERFVTGAVLVAGIGLVMLIGRSQARGDDRD
ncbi:MAG: hypothetical protein KJ698_08830 [Actinobacteria bacterium]|nr:hypothetical protein [Actinomycetota bacterium]